MDVRLKRVCGKYEADVIRLTHRLAGDPCRRLRQRQAADRVQEALEGCGYDLVFLANSVQGDGDFGGLIAQIEHALGFGQANKNHAFLSIRQPQAEDPCDGHRALAQRFVLAFSRQDDAVAGAQAQFLGHFDADQDRILIIIVQEAALNDIFGDQADGRFYGG